LPNFGSGLRASRASASASGSAVWSQHRLAALLSDGGGHDVPLFFAFAA